MSEQPAQLSILRRKQVEMRTGLSRSSIYARIAKGDFPSPIHLGNGISVGWVESEVEEWIKSRIETHKEKLKAPPSLILTLFVVIGLYNSPKSIV